MLPTFATDRDHALANHLMQPCLIRIIDNLRKATETLDWQSEYTQACNWPEGTTEAQQQQVAELAAQLDQADADTAPQIEQALRQLPTPTPIYHLRLTQGERVADAGCVGTLLSSLLCGLCSRATRHRRCWLGRSRWRGGLDYPR
jgi:hypothetical protein